MNAYHLLNSSTVKYQAVNELTNKRELIDIEVAELPAGTPVFELFLTNDTWVMIPGYELYADGNGGLIISYDEN